MTNALDWPFIRRRHLIPVGAALIGLLLLGLPGRGIGAGRPTGNEALRQNLAMFMAQADRLERLSDHSDDFSPAECCLHSFLSVVEDLRSARAEYGIETPQALSVERLVRARERATRLARTREDCRRLAALEDRYEEAVAYLSAEAVLRPAKSLKSCFARHS
jgi:hypothetical protein